MKSLSNALVVAPDDQIRIKISSDLKQAFMAYCNENNLTVSGALRCLMYEAMTAKKQ